MTTVYHVAKIIYNALRQIAALDYAICIIKNKNLIIDCANLPNNDSHKLSK